LKRQQSYAVLVDFHIHGIDKRISLNNARSQVRISVDQRFDRSLNLRLYKSSHPEYLGF
jgi:hypothetical protein